MREPTADAPDETASAVVRRIASEETRPLRQSVLRPDRPLAPRIYSAGDEARSAHYGALLDGRIVGVASIYPESRTGSAGAPGWRIRGMAVAPEHRNRGLGGRLLEACLAHADGAGGGEVWCSARSVAAAFYRRHGFAEVGDEFDRPGIGPHVVMVRPDPRG